MADDGGKMGGIVGEAVMGEMFGHAEGLALRKSPKRLDRRCRDFIARSPFLVIGVTGADGRTDIHPRGDPPGASIAGKRPASRA